MENLATMSNSNASCFTDALSLGFENNYPKKFRKDPCTYTRTGGINVCACDETCARTFMPGVRVCVNGSLKKKRPIYIYNKNNKNKAKKRIR